MALTAAQEVRSMLDALQRHFDVIVASTSNQRILDATYEAEAIVAALWKQDAAVQTVDRWRGFGLTPLQSRLMDLLSARMGRIITRDAMSACWSSVGMDFPGGKNIEVQMTLIRRKLKTSVYRIKNHWGLGYSLEVKPT